MPPFPKCVWLWTCDNNHIFIQKQQADFSKMAQPYTSQSGFLSLQGLVRRRCCDNFLTNSFRSIDPCPPNPPVASKHYIRARNQHSEYKVKTQENILLPRKYTLKCVGAKGQNEWVDILKQFRKKMHLCVHTHTYTHRKQTRWGVNWEIWVKGICEFLVLFLQLFCKFKIISK